MEIRFQQFGIISPLKGYIEKIWVFETSARMPSDDMKLVVPNGRLLLLIPIRNIATGIKGGKNYEVPLNRIALVGMSDQPSIVDAKDEGPVSSLGIEISALGAYRFFRLRLKDIQNELNPLTDILGNVARSIEQRIAEACTISDKVKLLQSFLFSLFRQSEEDTIFEYCVNQIKVKGSTHVVKQLEKQTGYSSRWLNMKFEERLGLSPKNYSSIIRFQKYYQSLLADPDDVFRDKSFYDHYYDESHFIREFKRFTTLPPVKLMKAKNDFGKTFYKS